MRSRNIGQCLIQGCGAQLELDPVFDKERQAHDKRKLLTYSFSNRIKPKIVVTKIVIMVT